MSGQFGSTAECPSCGEQAEPEQDGDVLYFACVCGFEFGYVTVQQEETCAAGISLSHLAMLNGVDAGEAFGKTLGPSETAVFLGYRIPLRTEDN